MPFIDRDGTKIHWEAQGAGTPVLLVMGHRYSSAMWYPILPALAARHRVITLDNRGTGESGTSRNLTVATMGDDALAVLDAAGVDKAHIFGVSMGGVIVEDIAMRHRGRVRSLIVGCSGMLTADKPRAPSVVRLLYRLPPWALKLLMPKRANNGYGSAAPAGAVAQDMKVLENDPYSTRGVIAQAEAMSRYTTTKEAVAGLTMPSLVLHGDEDSTVPFKWGEELAATLPDARFVRVPGAGHNFFIAGGAAVNAAVLNFIAEVDAQG
ncbi:MAG TPA: alpha/beta hydrolase [Rhizomicrobium sp.]|jgi:pimeloyl-ACP methyl ester carboxylesterase|nr:alpha/beta hydrolase [Rhizomicrobium sp.]